jgi:hypothetical protein
MRNDRISSICFVGRPQARPPPPRRPTRHAEDGTHGGNMRAFGKGKFVTEGSTGGPTDRPTNTQTHRCMALLGYLYVSLGTGRQLAALFNSGRFFGWIQARRRRIAAKVGPTSNVGRVRATSTTVRGVCVCVCVCRTASPRRPTGLCLALFGRTKQGHEKVRPVNSRVA